MSYVKKPVEYDFVLWQGKFIEDVSGYLNNSWGSNVIRHFTEPGTQNHVLMYTGPEGVTMYYLDDDLFACAVAINPIDRSPGNALIVVDTTVKPVEEQGYSPYADVYVTAP